MVTLPFAKRPLIFAILASGIAATYGAVSLLNTSTFSDSLSSDYRPSEMIQENTLQTCWDAVESIYGIDEEAKYTWQVVPVFGGVGVSITKETPRPHYKEPTLKEAQARLKIWLKNPDIVKATGPVVEEMRCVYVSGLVSKTGESAIDYRWHNGKDRLVIPEDDEFHTILLY